MPALDKVENTVSRLLMLLIFLAQPVAAKDGHFLLAMCQEGEKGGELGGGFCVGAFAIILQAMEDPSDPLKGARACLPSDIGLGEVQETVVRTLEERPGFRVFNMLAGAALILQIEYPCE